MSAVYTLAMVQLGLQLRAAIAILATVKQSVYVYKGERLIYCGWRTHIVIYHNLSNLNIYVKYIISNNRNLGNHTSTPFYNTNTYFKPICLDSIQKPIKVSLHL